MIFCGITKDFCLTNEQQYDTIGQFWDELARLYGLENLQGLGYNWKDNKISFAIGLKNGCIKGCNLHIELPDKDWVTAKGKTDNLKQLYEFLKNYVMRMRVRPCCSILLTGEPERRAVQIYGR